MRPVDGRVLQDMVMIAKRHVPHYLMVLPFMLLFAGFLALLFGRGSRRHS